MDAYVFLLIGMAAGASVAYFYAVAKSRQRAQNAVSTAELEVRYVSRELHVALGDQLEQVKRERDALQADYLRVSNAIAAQRNEIDNLQKQLTERGAAEREQQAQMKLQFEHLASRLLEEKSQKFVETNRAALAHLLDPLRERIREFEQGVRQTYLDESKDRSALKLEIEYLRQLNQQLSDGATQLTNALKGNSKTQGDWGEFQLETLLERAGLEKGTHFETQASFKDQDGAQKRPDFIIRLPDGKCLIVDSKVSLKAYERFFNAETEADRKKYLKDHVDSVRGHVRDLSRKQYERLYQIDTPDYLLLFVPVEGALSAALQADPNLYLDAMDRNIVIVTSATLIATMRTVAYIWKQDKQQQSVQEIAKQSGLLYDKFVGFVEDMQRIGEKLDDAQGAYAAAMNKLKTSKKYGDTLIGRAKRIKELGADASKSLPEELG